MLPLLPDMLRQPAAFRHLSRCQLVLAAFVGVRSGLEFQSQRCPVEFQDLAEAVDQIASVGVGHIGGLVAVDDDDRWVAAALMGITQLDAASMNQWGLVLLDRCLKDAGQLRCGEVAGRIRVGVVDLVQ